MFITLDFFTSLATTPSPHLVIPCHPARPKVWGGLWTCLRAADKISKVDKHVGDGATFRVLQNPVSVFPCSLDKEVF